MAPFNLHATALILGDRGLLIAGESGTGKTSLALLLVERAVRAGAFARLVSDDQVFLSSRGGRLVAAAPPAIAGLAEFRPLGPVAVASESRAVLDLMVRLDLNVPRIADEVIETILGCTIPRMTLAAGDRHGAAHAILTRLELSPFR